MSGDEAGQLAQGQALQVKGGSGFRGLLVQRRALQGKGIRGLLVLGQALQGKGGARCRGLLVVGQALQGRGGRGCNGCRLRSDEHPCASPPPPGDGTRPTHAPGPLVMVRDLPTPLAPGDGTRPTHAPGPLMMVRGLPTPLAPW